MNIVIATCRKRPELSPSDDLIRLELEALGAKVSATPWDLISSDDSGHALVCLRSTWDYHLRAAEFRRWVEAFRPSPSTLWNPAEAVLRNLDKMYLRKLAAAGVAIPNTRWFDPGQRPEFESRGEVSLVFLAGGFSHTVRKLPATGDFRVQSDFGGRFERVAATPALRAFGEASSRPSRIPGFTRAWMRSIRKLARS